MADAFMSTYYVQPTKQMQIPVRERIEGGYRGGKSVGWARARERQTGARGPKLKAARTLQALAGS